jgi:hypothetical protein
MKCRSTCFLGAGIYRALDAVAANLGRSQRPREGKKWCTVITLGLDSATQAL